MIIRSFQLSNGFNVKNRLQKRFFIINPIVVNADNVILAGHTRLQALKNAGYTGELDVRVVDYLTPEQEKAYRLADNKTNEFASWDYSKLENEIGTLDLDLSAFGFFESEINDDIEIERKDISNDFTLENKVVVECASEREQEQLYNELIDRGFKCKVE